MKFESTEECDECGGGPTEHMGHGSYRCKPCFDAWWCPKCGYDQRGGNHVCPSEAQRAKDKRWHAAFELSCENDADQIAELLTDRDALAWVMIGIHLNRMVGPHPNGLSCKDREEYIDLLKRGEGEAHEDYEHERNEGNAARDALAALVKAREESFSTVTNRPDLWAAAKAAIR